MADEPVTLDFIAVQQRQILSELAQMRAEMQTFRDDMTVLTAIAVRLENSMNSLAGQVGTMVQQHRRFNERLSRLENAE